MKNNRCFSREFHVSRQARDRYGFEQRLFASDGRVIFADFHAVRLFVRKINEHRDLSRFPEQAVRAGQLNALGLIDEIFHHIVQDYLEKVEPAAMTEAHDFLVEKMSAEAVDAVLYRFCADFPPTEIYQGRKDITTYIDSETGGIPNRLIVLEELLMLWLTASNPACFHLSELFDDSKLKVETRYPEAVLAVQEYFKNSPPVGPGQQSLIDLLQSPSKAVPHSLTGQLEYIRKNWGILLGKYAYRMLTVLDVIKEEDKPVFTGPGPAHVYTYEGFDSEPESYSLDLDWMPYVVMMAKNTYVWLDQLSKKYGRQIGRLDQIPDEEIDMLASRGFTGLWLIGVWERSQASRRIKQLCGNPDAMASAYSLREYRIADDLGGDAAFENLKQKTKARGIRLACDMVPNHMGIDSPWLMDQPEWFIGSPACPFPVYRFSGTDLSNRPDVSIRIEDHYYDRTDAAVTFLRIDHSSGEHLYIYHGNDGTQMPWNDTAQLNYLLPEVRETVIQTILDVARRFHIIRFDAAMTLTKRHYQRLWFPEPGTGGAIPSRAEKGMSRAEFNDLMPIEFWREVVDRINQEVPDTLLLAEAFWLMEGYFVRTLGMHRVYNSAFMNMLRDEDNAKYRSVMKNTLEFDPEILKRFVNFLNNPDERTAVDQFGKGDKYFGVCVMAATLPGMPMFGHGQIEGFSEKYGMEYHKAYWEETPDQYLVERHQKEVFPLLKQRRLFADVRNFLLYDFDTGYINEDVFAYSNCWENQRALVIYHNKYAQTSGWIRDSVAFPEPSGAFQSRSLVRKKLGEGLHLNPHPRFFSVFKDHLSGLEFIRSNREIHEKGVFFELRAYQCFVFIDWREFEDDPNDTYAQLCGYLDGRGVPSIRDALIEIVSLPVQRAFSRMVNSKPGHWFWKTWLQSGEKPDIEKNLDLFRSELKTFEDQVKLHVRLEGELDINQICLEIKSFFDLKTEIGSVLNRIGSSRSVPKSLQPGLRFRLNWNIVFFWIILHETGGLQSGTGNQSSGINLFYEWRLSHAIREICMNIPADEETAQICVTTLKLLIQHQGSFTDFASLKPDMTQMAVQIFHDVDLQQFTGVHRYQDTVWFNKELFDDLLDWIAIILKIQIASQGLQKQDFPERMRRIDSNMAEMKTRALQAKFQVVRMIEG